MPDVDAWGRKFILRVIQTPNLSLGPMLDEFERRMADYLGTKYAVAVNSGTSGLHLAVRALNINEEDEVVTTPFSFIASANCILFERAIPVFVDIDEKTLNIDVNKLEDIVRRMRNNSQKLKTILPVHIFGRPCEMGEILDIAEKYELKVIEDACEAIGAEYLTDKITDYRQKTTDNNKETTDYDKTTTAYRQQTTDNRPQTIDRRQQRDGKIWKKVGTFGECGIFAFYPNKQITTGEGGMIVTNDKNIDNLCKSMRNQGRSDNGEWLQHERLGYNYRISDINCALGIVQLNRIDEILAKRARVAKLYRKKLAEIGELILPQSERNKKISWFVYVVRLVDKFSREDRDHILIKLKEKGIGCSNYFAPIHLQPFYKKMFGYKRGDFPITEKVSERTIALPFYNCLREDQIDFVCKTLKKIIFRIRKKIREYRPEIIDYRPQTTDYRLKTRN